MLSDGVTDGEKNVRANRRLALVSFVVSCAALLSVAAVVTLSSGYGDAMQMGVNQLRKDETKQEKRQRRREWRNRKKIRAEKRAENRAEREARKDAKEDDPEEIEKVEDCNMDCMMPPAEDCPWCMDACDKGMKFDPDEGCCGACVDPEEIEDDAEGHRFPTPRPIPKEWLRSLPMKPPMPGSDGVPQNLGEGMGAPETREAAVVKTKETWMGYPIIGAGGIGPASTHYGSVEAAVPNTKQDLIFTMEEPKMGGPLMMDTKKDLIPKKDTAIMQSK